LFTSFTRCTTSKRRALPGISRQIEGEQSDRKQSAGEQQKRLQTEDNPDERKKYVTEIDIAENDITESTMTGFDYASYNAKLLDAHPEYELTYIVAPPRMALYMDYSYFH